jgi:two-component system sensor histidine kinase YesM
MGMHFKKIQTRLFFAMMITSMIPAGIVSTILFMLVSHTIQNEVFVTTSRTAVDMKEKINEYFASLDNGVYNIYYNTKLLNALKSGNQLQSDNSNYYESSRDIDQFFMSIYNYSKIKDILGIYLFDQNRDLLHYFTPSATYVSKSQYNDIYPNDALTSDGRPRMNVLYNNLYAENILHYAQPLLYHGETRIGLVGIDLKLQSFRNLVEKYNLFLGSKIIIIDGSDKIIYHTDLNKVGKVFNDEVKEDQRIIEKPLDFLNWRLVYIYQINPQTLIIRNTALVVMVISFSLVLLLSFTISHSITRPIKTLARVMKQLEIGDFNTRVEIRGQDEVNLLGAHFNRMAQKIEQLIEDEYKSQIIRKEAELKALHVQINPHFLYNTLQTMGSIANLRNAPEIKIMCKALSNMFRYSIKMKNEWVTVKEEMLHVRNYLIIINKRYGDMLRIHLVVQEGAYKYLIPKLIFQPIVENCIEHGLIPSGHPKKLLKLSIKPDLQNFTLIVEILDNGVGISLAKFEKLCESLQESSSSPVLKKDDSIGLLNVQTRIQMLCGSKFGLTVTSKFGSGTRVIIRLPLREEQVHV